LNDIQVEHNFVLPGDDGSKRMATSFFIDGRSEYHAFDALGPNCVIVPVPSGTAEAFHKRAGASIPEGLREALMPLVAVIEQLTIRIKEYDRKVEQLAEDRHPDTAALTQVCGVGSLTALAYILTLEDEQRYRRGRSVGAWLGRSPVSTIPGKASRNDASPRKETHTFAACWSDPRSTSSARSLRTAICAGTAC
jgi:hypothetical protein